MIDKGFLICLAKSLNLIGETTMKKNDNIAVKEFIIYTTPAPLGLFGKFVSMVCKIDMNNQTMTPEIIITDRQNELEEMLSKLSSYNVALRVLRVNESSMWQGIMSDYSLMTNDRLSNHFTDINKVLVSSVVAGIVNKNLTTMLDYCNSIRFDKNRIMYGCENIGRNVIRDQNKFEFVDNGLNLIFVRPFFDKNGRLTNVNFKVEMSLEILRANKNDRAF